MARFGIFNIIHVFVQMVYNGTDTLVPLAQFAVVEEYLIPRKIPVNVLLD
jgi:hypothetical protein